MEASHKKQLFWVSALFLFLPFYAMDVVKFVKCRKTVVAPNLTNCGLTLVYMPQNIARDVIMRPYLSFQDIGWLKQVSKVCNTYWNAENICLSPKGCISRCSSPACKRLVQCHYEYRTKILAHFSKQKNSRMLAHIWAYDAEIRNKELQSFVPFRENLFHVITSAENEMYRYCRRYHSVHKQRVKQLEDALRRNYFFLYSGKSLDALDSKVDLDFIKALWSESEREIELLKTILLGSGFNIFKSSYRKKRARIELNFGLRFMLEHVGNRLRDVDLLLAIVGGFVQPYMFKKIFKYLSVDMLKSLFKRDAIDEIGVDKHGRSATYYWNKKLLA